MVAELVALLPPWAWTSSAWMSAASCWNGSTEPVCPDTALLCVLALVADDAVDEPPQAASMLAGNWDAWVQMLDAILPMDTMPGS